MAYWKQTDPRRVYCSFNVGGGWAWDNGSEYHVKGGGRGLDWNHAAPQSMDNYDKDLHFPRNYKDSVPNHSPIIAHEQGQWCAFPDLRERGQYTGVYKTYNFDIFADLLRDNGMATMAGKFLHASGKLQSLCYRLEMERNLRTKDYAGFMLLGLNDYSGQGTALVGPLNVFGVKRVMSTAPSGGSRATTSSSWLSSPSLSLPPERHVMSPSMSTMLSMARIVFGPSCLMPSRHQLEIRSWVHLTSPVASVCM